MDRLKKFVKSVKKTAGEGEHPDNSASSDVDVSSLSASSSPEEGMESGQASEHAASSASAATAGDTSSDSPVNACSPEKSNPSAATGDVKESKPKLSNKDAASQPRGEVVSCAAASRKKTPGTRRLMKEYQDMMRRGPSSEITCQLVNENLFEWDIFLKQIDPDSTLYKEMAEADVPEIHLRLKFPERYPFVPPFMRVVAPYIAGGYVMEGGAICMELLTTDGWSGAYTAESIVRQFSASLIQGKARLGKLGKGKVPYSQANAEHSFSMVVKVHRNRGWYTPPKEKG